MAPVVFCTVREVVLDESLTRLSTRKWETIKGSYTAIMKRGLAQMTLSLVIGPRSSVVKIFS